MFFPFESAVPCFRLEASVVRYYPQSRVWSFDWSDLVRSIKFHSSNYTYQEYTGQFAHAFVELPEWHSAQIQYRRRLQSHQHWLQRLVARVKHSTVTSKVCHCSSSTVSSNVWICWRTSRVFPQSSTRIWIFTSHPGHATKVPSTEPFISSSSNLFPRVTSDPQYLDQKIFIRNVEKVIKHSV